MESDQFFVYVATATIMLTVSMIIFTKARFGEGQGNFWLGAYYSSNLVALVISYLVLSPFIHKVPHFFRVGNIFFLLMVPLSWVYFRTMVKGGRVGWTDLIHLTPVILYLVDYFPFFLLPGEEKIRILNGLDRFGLKGGFNEGWLMPRGANGLLRFLFFAGYWIAQWFILRKAYPELMPMRRRWLSVFLYTSLLIFLPAVIILLMGKFETYTIVVNTSAMLAGIIQCYYLLANPDVLYGFPSEPLRAPGLVNVMNQPELPISDHEDSVGRQIDPTLAERIRGSLHHLMEDEHIFLEPELKVYHLAERIGVPVYKISAYLNDNEQKSFIDFVNHQRVSYCIAKIRSGEARTKTLEAISLESGFSSRSTFIRAFKKFTGTTPSEYLEQTN